MKIYSVEHFEPIFCTFLYINHLEYLKYFYKK